MLEYEDLFDGSHVIEDKTEQLKALATRELADIDAMGGAVEAVGYMKESLVGSHIDRVRGIETGALKVVGVKPTESETSPLGPVMTLAKRSTRWWSASRLRLHEHGASPQCERS